jgi:hypothetical protein
MSCVPVGGAARRLCLVCVCVFVCVCLWVRLRESHALCLSVGGAARSSCLVCVCVCVCVCLWVGLRKGSAFVCVCVCLWVGLREGCALCVSVSGAARRFVWVALCKKRYTEIVKECVCACRSGRRIKARQKLKPGRLVVRAVFCAGSVIS